MGTGSEVSQSVDDVLKKLEAASKKTQEQAAQAPAAPPETPPATPDLPLGEHKSCPRCGWTHGLTEKPLQEDIDNYVRSIFGSRFKKTFELYDGKLKLTFSMTTASEADKIQTYLSKLPKELSDYEHRELDVKVKLLATLEKLEVQGLQAKEFERMLPDGSPDDIRAAFEKRFGDASGGAASQLARALELFNVLVAAILTHGFDINFWKGAKST